ncbi:cytochrome P450 83B1-like [Henckelia pumila]|uniref:cytochrome P450 83B1-like n=1 Tax=Henckelia pumila TaxID=405737 RepID=UPI003C6DBFEF
MINIMYFLLLALSFSIIIVFSYLLKSKIGKKSSVLPPGPKGLPLIGNLHEIDTVHPHVYLHQLAEKYGPLMSLRFGFRPMIIISSARVAKIALTKNDLALSGRPPLIGLKTYSYNGHDIAFSNYSETWREMRRLGVIHLFSVKQVASFLPIRKEKVSLMIKDMMEKSHSSQVINLSQAAYFLTNRIICRAAFGKEYDELGKRKFSDVFKQAQELSIAFFFGDYFPFLGWIDKLTGMISRLNKNLGDLDRFFQELIQDHLDPNRPETMKGDILDLMINLKQDQAAAFPIEWENMKGILMNVFGGTDTSASLIVWAMTALIKKPQAMKKAQEEVRNVVGAKGVVDEDDIQHLPYLKAIIKETLRLFPPIPLSVPRETMEKCTIDGYEIPAKTMAYVNFHAIGLDPEYWESPTEFMPDRFLNSNIDYRGHDFGLLPFGSGRRGCPGMNFGIASVELALSNLLYSFDWELPHGMKVEDVDMELFPGLTTSKKNDLYLVGKCYKYNIQ